MNAKEYKEFKRKAEERYKKAIEIAEKQRIEELSAIETVWRMSHTPRKNNVDSEIQTATQSLVSNPTIYGSLSNAVRESLQYVPDVFTKNQIRAAITKIAPNVSSNSKDSSITGSLIRLVEDGIIEQVYAGKGSRPSTYRKKTENQLNLTGTSTEYSNSETDKNDS